MYVYVPKKKKKSKSRKSNVSMYTSKQKTHLTYYDFKPPVD